MKVTHLYHSGFVVELTGSVLIFDWFRGDLPVWEGNKAVYVFVTHGHPDHYSARIWELEKKFDKVCYIIDSCCEQERKGDNIYHVQPDREYDLKPLFVKTLLSNNMGVAYLVKIEGMEIFHCGDLNVWHWKEKSERENAYSERFFIGEIEKLRGHRIDAAMIPLDPRLEENAPRAIGHFMQIVGCRYLFPMHYWDRRAEILSYLDDPRLAPYADKTFLDSLTTDA